MTVRLLIVAALLSSFAVASMADADAAAAARKAWRQADTDAARHRALDDLAASDDLLAAEFMLELLRKDTRARPASPEDLRPAMRAKVVAAMCKLRADACMQALADASAAVDSDADHSLALEQCDLLTAVAANKDSATSLAAIRALLTRPKSPWLTLAAVEAIRAAEKLKPGAGKRFRAEVVALLGKEHAKLLACELLTVNLFACLKVMTDKDQPTERAATVRALVDWQTWSNNTKPRLHGLADRLLHHLTGETCTLTDETLKFWQWWLDNNAGDKRAAKPRAEYIPFTAPTIGNRTVFVIDTSSSMSLAITDAARDDLRKRAEAQKLNLPWKNIHTKLDLARELLIDAISRIEPRAELPEHDQPAFAIVTYSKSASCVTAGWLKADLDGRNKGEKLARALSLDSVTNIHGGLAAAFRISDAGTDALSPETDTECVLSGAHTIVFLSDGFATWSDDSKPGNSVPDPRNPKGTIGDGALVDSANILADIARLNRFRKVCINTFGIGNYDRVLLRALADQHDGTPVDWSFKEEQKNDIVGK